MRGKYITKNIMLACLSKPGNRKNDIHAQLKETIAERRKIMQELEKLSQRQDYLLARIGREAA